jgi:lipopolysaccharide/colanic/teichoic acid biosynthesis glycosyltransferase
LVPWSTIFYDAAKPTARELAAAGIAEIIVTENALSEQEAIDFALVALEADVPTIDQRTFYARLFERLPLDEVSKRWVLERGIVRPRQVIVVAKRTADIVVSGAGLILLMPVMGILALAVKMSSPGPVLFAQVRQGRFLQPFTIRKFRTMRDGVGGAGFTTIHDDRVTRVGRFLRRSHLDELPQLWNIFRGDMSLVGPRPEDLIFASQMARELPLYELRYLVRPGLTGHAQLQQGYAMDTALDTQIKLSYDLYYLCSYSMRLDLRILIRTFLFLIRGSR